MYETCEMQCQCSSHLWLLALGWFLRTLYIREKMKFKLYHSLVNSPCTYRVIESDFEIQTPKTSLHVDQTRGGKRLSAHTCELPKHCHFVKFSDRTHNLCNLFYQLVWIKQKVSLTIYPAC